MAENITEVRQLNESDAVAPPVRTESNAIPGPIIAGNREMIQIVKIEELLTQETRDVLFVRNSFSLLEVSDVRDGHTSAVAGADGVGSRIAWHRVIDRAVRDRMAFAK